MTMFFLESPRNKSPGAYNYRFKISSIQNDWIIKRVELRLFKRNIRKKQKDRTTKFYRTDITLDSEHEIQTQSFMVSSTGFGWLSFDVKNIAKSFLKHSTDILDINIRIRPIWNKSPIFEFSTTTNMATRALFIVYSDSKPKTSLQQEHIAAKRFTSNLVERSMHKHKNNNNKNKMEREKRDIDRRSRSNPSNMRALKRDKRGLQRHSRSNTTNNTRTFKRNKRSVTKQTKPCRKKNLNLSFYENDHFQDIDYPEKINLYRCGGGCPQYMNQSNLFSEHAILKLIIVQTMNYSKKKSRRLMPCCIPRTFHHLDVIKDLPGVGKIKQLMEEAVVDTCWCA